MKAGQVILGKLTGRLGIITQVYSRTNTVGVMWAGGNYAVKEQPADLIPATFNASNLTIHKAGTK